jgi:hypothetical protein
MLYPYSLWEYKRKAVSQPVDVAVVDYSECRVTTSKWYTFTVEGSSSGNDTTTDADAIVVWVDYEIDEHAVLSGNPMLINNSYSIISDNNKQQQPQVHMLSNCYEP